MEHKKRSLKDKIIEKAKSVPIPVWLSLIVPFGIPSLATYYTIRKVIISIKNRKKYETKQ